MWREVFRLVRQLVTLAQDTERNKTEIETLREELRELSLTVEGLKNELRRVAEHEAHEREKWVLKLENELLRFERRLPGGKHRALPNGGA